MVHRFHRVGTLHGENAERPHRRTRQRVFSLYGQRPGQKQIPLGDFDMKDVPDSPQRIRLEDLVGSVLQDELKPWAGKRGKAPHRCTPARHYEKGEYGETVANVRGIWYNGR